MLLMTPLVKIRRQCLVLLVFYIIFYYTVLLIFKEQAALFSCLFSLAEELLCFAAIYYARRFWSKEQRLTWLFFAGGIFLYAMGDSLWFFLEIICGEKVSPVSICDFFYLTSCGMTLLALQRFIRQECHHFVLETAFNILICLFVSATLLFKYTILPVWETPSLSLVTKSINMIYPVCDLAFLTGMLSLLFYSIQTQKIHLLSVRFIILSFCLQFAADQLYLLIDSAYFSGSLIDPLWPASAACLVIAAFSSDIETISQNRHLSFRMLNKASLFLPYLLTVSLICMINVRYFAEDPLITGLTLTIFVIILRQIFVQRRNHHLLELLTKANTEILQAKKLLEQQNLSLQQLSRQKETEAHTDFLTGLFNRRYMNQYLRNLSKTNADELQIGFLIIDIDFFKQINDGLGHQAGDLVLHSLGSILRSMPESRRIDARIGGDEFLLVFQNTAPAEMKDFACRLMDTAARTILPALDKKLSLSIGMTHWQGPVEDYSMERLFREADQALYQAKNSGRQKYVFFQPTETAASPETECRI